MEIPTQTTPQPRAVKIAPRPVKRKTNEEFVRDLMRFSDQGALALRAFVRALPKGTRGTVDGVLSKPITISEYRKFWGI